MDMDEDIEGESAENEENPQQNVDRNENGYQNDEGSFSPHMQTDTTPEWDNDDIWNRLTLPRLDEV